ncbi:MAG: sugar phosphate isomerase/epimerase family protein [Protaetiibacter sp.]
MASIRFGTNIITFYDREYWGLPKGLPNAQWVAAFGERRREFFDRMLDGVREAGLEGVELAPGAANWESALAAYGNAAAFRAALDARGLVLSSSFAAGKALIGDALADPEKEKVADDNFRRHAEFVAEMGASTIVTSNIPRTRFGNTSPDDTATAADFEEPVARETHERFADQLNRLGAITAPHGVSIAIHTDAYSVCSRNEDIASVLSLTDPKSVLICPDAGHITLDGGDAVAVLRDNIDRIPTMHWKDCIGHLGGHTLRGDGLERHEVMLTWFRVLGTGIVDWHEWMRVLKQHSWRGWAIEEIDNSPDPVGELRQGLGYFHDELAPIYS